jgi:hypothetical protein
VKWREAGFSQRKPREPGVYFVRTSGHLPMAPKQRLKEGWDVADVMFFAGSFTNPSDNREESACWLITQLDGCGYTWKRGMWLKGPLTPHWRPR